MHMKTTVILLSLLLTITVSAQESKKFNIRKGEFFLELTKKDKIENGQKKNNTQPGSYNGRFKYSEAFAKAMDPIFKEVFEYPNIKNPDLLKKVHVYFLLDEHCKVIDYEVSFPIKYAEDLSALYEKFYHYCERVESLDLTPFIYKFNADEFTGVSFTINIYNFYKYAEDPIRMKFAE